MLARPRDRRVEQAGDADPVRQSTFDGGFDAALCQFAVLTETGSAVDGGVRVLRGGVLAAASALRCTPEVITKASALHISLHPRPGANIRIRSCYRAQATYPACVRSI
jgi:hypothetical protein